MSYGSDGADFWLVKISGDGQEGEETQSGGDEGAQKRGVKAFP